MKKRVCIVVAVVVAVILAFLAFFVVNRLANDKILGIIELNETTKSDLKKLSLKEHMNEVWDLDNGEWVYERWSYTDYTVKGVKGELRIVFGTGTGDEYVKTVTFSAKERKKNAEELKKYLINTYGKEYKVVRDDEVSTIIRWEKDDMSIEYVLVEDSTIEIRWR